MHANDYQAEAMRTANTNNRDELVLNGILGLCGETGEVADLIKKARFQGHEFDREKAIDELSDVCWYVAILAEGLGVKLGTVMHHNVNKLRKRYPNGFEAQRSINRDNIQGGGE